MILSSIGLQTYIWNNNLKSVLLLICFPLLVLSMIWVGGFLYYLTSFESRNLPISVSEQSTLLVKEIWIFVFIGVSAWLCFALYFHQRLVNLISGGNIVKRKNQKKLYNLLENLCISRGFTTPKLAIIKSPARNAFASGISKKSYTITLTKGLISDLTDQELEAVLAHELAHIMNNDTKLLTTCVVFVGILWLLSEAGLQFLNLKKVNLKRANSAKNLRIVLILILIFSIGYFFAALLHLSLSRKREYLADACCVDITKNPDAMISALQKISGNAEIKFMPQSLTQMCIENKTKFMRFFPTHPPIKKRIDALRKYALAQS